MKTKGFTGKTHSEEVKRKISQSLSKYPGTSNLDRYLRRKYVDFDEEKYKKLKEKQNGLCAICGNPETRVVRGIKYSLCIDHDHSTKRVRGLLCCECNRKLGTYEALYTHFSKIEKYLKGS